MARLFSLLLLLCFLPFSFCTLQHDAPSRLIVLPDYEVKPLRRRNQLLNQADSARGHFAWPRSPLDLVHEALDDKFTAFAHPTFPNTVLRIKPRERNSSRSDPANDDVLMTISGGPGCAGGGTAFAVMGPCLVQDPKGGANATQPNPYSWNTNANYLFLDQPVGVGYSYSSIGETVTSTEELSKDVLRFTHLFFEVFSYLKGRPFHMTGGSYSGRSAPVFLSDILDFNKHAIDRGLAPINVKTLSIGNGQTDYKTMVEAYYTKQCTKNSVPPVQTIAKCVAMKAALPRCMKSFQAECIDHQDTIGCRAAWLFCFENLALPIYETGRSLYDLTRECDGLDCYPQSGYVTEWASLNSTRELLGVDEDAPGFVYCSNQVLVDFYSGFPDPIRAATPYVSGLLERGIRVMIFAGVYDWACNDLGNEAWTLALDWTGHDAFKSEQLREWTVDGEVAGLTRAANGLTWATVYGAGHMSSFDKPRQTLALMQRWLRQEAI